MLLENTMNEQNKNNVWSKLIEKVSLGLVRNIYVLLETGTLFKKTKIKISPFRKKLKNKNRNFLENKKISVKSPIKKITF